ncbi:MULTISPECIES: MarR family winged helix-turn-helix transcriptional regulator [unclassified Sphingomonas]|uniref:MarR family winged helix-turn-helix transcriptional regulator n=1 Tax=unclassified Sphingomonas TaxID=196159 RepID=UPI0007012DB0|nr:MULTISPECIES: MarR family transcriptional regulator [unclassified Sphingomonas]KQX25710.1 MarR family transcriptional regulator [Sphingomonas sp. Root1294]KQY66699.1 MarR family transcriptional regulator [Sphingomonas sp. Root50]KRB90424.1 MarR family transcriptional regulator [Sphingomonas sp. Root720]
MTSPASGASGPLDDMLCFAVYAAGHAFNRVYKPLLDRLGLTYPQYLVILALRHTDGQTVGALGEHLFLESNTLTPLIKRLEAAGFVRRQRDTADERVVRVHLTDKGRAAGKEASCLSPELFDAIGLPVGEIAALQQRLTTLGDNLRRSAEERG